MNASLAEWISEEHEHRAITLAQIRAWAAARFSFVSPRYLEVGVRCYLRRALDAGEVVAVWDEGQSWAREVPPPRYQLARLVPISGRTAEDFASYVIPEAETAQGRLFE